MSILIAYFSRKDQNYLNGNIVELEKGNTEIAAEYINENVQADMFKIEPVVEYSKDYNECIAQAQADKKRNARPKLKKYPESIDKYDTVFVGYPNYWGTAPMAVFSFLEEYDFGGKTIIPFCTHEGSGLGNSVKDIKNCCKNSEIKNGLAIHGAEAKNSEKVIKKWLKGLNF